MDTGVYLIENVANGRRYVGSANSLKKRFREHRRQLSEGRHHSRFLQRAWNKYGPLFFRFTVVAYCSRDDLLFYEQRLIDGLRPDYNTAPTAGSQLGYRHTEDSRRKMSFARRRNPSSPRKGMKHTAETLAKLSESRKGKGTGPRSAEWKRNIGLSQKGKVVSQEARAKIADKLRGHVQSAETIAKRVEKLRGRKMPKGFAEAASLRMTGYKCSEAHCVSIGKAKAKLTDEQVREIRARRAQGEKRGSLAVEFNIDPASITNIVKQLSYKWVE
jgi:group I intron endonuclease